MAYREFSALLRSPAVPRRTPSAGSQPARRVVELVALLRPECRATIFAMLPRESK